MDAKSPPPSKTDLSSYNKKTFADLPKANAAAPSMAFLGMLWLLFVLNRAVHPLAIDLSKQVTSIVPQTNASYVIGTRVSLNGVGDRYQGHRFLADVMDITKNSVKVRYTGGGYKRFDRSEFETLLTQMPKADVGYYEVGMQVRLKGTGARYEGRYFMANVVDVTSDTVKVQYSTGGWKRFPRAQFAKLLTSVPDFQEGHYEEGMHVRMQGTGRWAGNAFYVDIIDITDDTVKVQYADGMYKRMSKSKFEELLAQRPEESEAVKELHYRKLTPVLVKSFLCFVVCNILALLDNDGWKAGLSRCYTGPSVKLFAFIGIVYAIGDYLEMMSMGGMDGAAYQVLLQSKLVITAFMMWFIKGRPAKQTRTQWAALVTVTLGMVIFMTTQSAGKSNSGGNSGPGLFATCLVLMKVVVSCYAAVMSDSSLKKYKDLPLYAQLSQLFLPWGVASFVLALIFEPAAMSSPSAFFHGWNAGTVLVMLSFAVKTVLTMTLLKVLDSISKNIGEAVAVLVIYLMQILLPNFSQKFEMNTFIAMTTVVMTVTTYMFLKQDLDASKAAAAKKSDAPV